MVVDGVTTYNWHTVHGTTSRSLFAPGTIGPQRNYQLPFANKLNWRIDIDYDHVLFANQTIFAISGSNSSVYPTGMKVTLFNMLDGSQLLWGLTSDSMFYVTVIPYDFMKIPVIGCYITQNQTPQVILNCFDKSLNSIYTEFLTMGHSYPDINPKTYLVSMDFLASPSYNDNLYLLITNRGSTFSGTNTYYLINVGNQSVVWNKIDLFIYQSNYTTLSPPIYTFIDDDTNSWYFFFLESNGTDAVVSIHQIPYLDRPDSFVLLNRVNLSPWTKKYSSQYSLLPIAFNFPTITIGINSHSGPSTILFFNTYRNLDETFSYDFPEPIVGYAASETFRYNSIIVTTQSRLYTFITTYQDTYNTTIELVDSLYFPNNQITSVWPSRSYTSAYICLNNQVVQYEYEDGLNITQVNQLDHPCKLPPMPLPWYQDIINVWDGTYLVCSEGHLEVYQSYLNPQGPNPQPPGDPLIGLWIGLMALACVVFVTIIALAIRGCVKKSSYKPVN